MGRRAAAGFAAGLSLALPAAAAGQAPGAVSLELERVHRAGHDDVVLRGDRMRVRGVVTPYVPGQTVTVRLYRGRTKLAAKAAAIRPLRGGAKGGFAVSLQAVRGVRLTVRASHRATPAQGTMVAKARHVLAVAPHAAPGARGPLVRLLQSRLARLRYAVSSSGHFDAATARAVVAYRKVTGMSRVPVASAGMVRSLLHGRGAFKPRYPGHGKHVEADLSRQVMALVEGGRVHRIYGVSSGKASTPTVLGAFRVYSKTYGTNSLGMVHASYFIGGYAVHGYASVPTFPASHGCVRVPIPSALSIFSWLRVGDRVDVYG